MAYRPDIDGLRAIAVSLVLVFHAFPKFLSGGFIGVDVFFVVSGFLITGIIMRADFSFSVFYYRRARRILPALALVVGASLVVGWFLLTPRQFEALGRQAAASAIFVPNFLFWSETGYFAAAAGTKPLLHLWSLGVEEQFYIVWPLLILAARALSGRHLWMVLLGLTVVSFAYCLSINGYYPDMAFYWPTSRAWELSAGGLLVILGQPRLRSRVADVGVVAGIIAIVWSGIHLQAVPGFPGWLTTPAVIGTMLVVYCGATSGISRTLLGSWPMELLGKVSYPLYLWHWPVLVYGAIWQGGTLSTPQSIAALFISLGCAFLTYYFVELPQKRIRLKTAAFSATAALVIVGFAGFATRWQSHAPSPYPLPLQEALAYENYDFSSDAYSPGCWLRTNQTPDTMLSLCVKTGRSDVIAVWGDSHAARLSPGMRNVFGAERITEMARDSCPPLYPFDTEGCIKTNAAFLEKLKANPPKKLIMFGAWQNYATDWGPGSTLGNLLADTIKRVKAAGITDILLVGPAPKFVPILPAMLMQNWQKTRAYDLPDRLNIDREETAAVDRAFASVAAAAGVQYLSLLDVFCNEDGCLTKVPGTRSDLVTWDYGHLTTAAATFVAGKLDGWKDSRANSSPGAPVTR